MSPPLVSPPLVVLPLVSLPLVALPLVSLPRVAFPLVSLPRVSLPLVSCVCVCVCVRACVRLSRAIIFLVCVYVSRVRLSAPCVVFFLVHLRTMNDYISRLSKATTEEQSRRGHGIQTLVSSLDRLIIWLLGLVA